MSRRYAVNTGEYPEHLNPFREDIDADGLGKNKFNTAGRRRLRTVLNVTSWTLFQTKAPKPVERETNVSQKSNKNKFMTMTPKLSRHLLERLSMKTKRNKNISQISPTSNSVHGREPRYSVCDFTIMPKSSREKFALKSERKEEDAETASYLWVDTTRVPDGTSSSAATTPMSEEYELTEDEMKYTKQGAKPKKKRQAPLPPSLPVNTVAHTHVNTIEETDSPLASSVPASPESSPKSSRSLNLTIQEKTEDNIQNEVGLSTTTA